MDTNNHQLATFAGGCFWCMVSPFEKKEGVLTITSGYTGGHTEHPTYEQVCTDQTGHVEAVQIAYDSTRCQYEDLLSVFWEQIDPTDDGGQFHDRGDSYTTAIFYHDDNQKELAQASKDALDKSGKFTKPIVTKLLPATTFHEAEEHHQDYHHKNRLHYMMYRKGSGREAFIKKTWG